MSRLTRADFVRRYENNPLDLNKVDSSMKDRLWEAGATKWGISQADTNRDGKVSGTQELSRLFDYVDRYDTNGSYGSIDTTNWRGGQTASGKVVSVLDLMMGGGSVVPSSPSTPSTSGPSSTDSASGVMSSKGRQQMQAMLDFARRDSVGRRPDGYCYSHVADYIDRVGYGNIPKWGFNANIPSSHWSEARQFAEYLNKNGNADRLGLKRLDLDNPYDAPPGAIVVVRAGTPGTGHPTAGDIAIKGEGNAFYNGGEMTYYGSNNFWPGNNYVLGIYVPK